MRGYRNFLITFSVVLILYVVAELNRPMPVSWDVSLQKSDKNPYGGYIVYNRLRDIFPAASIASYRLPVYDQVNNYSGVNSAYIIIAPSFEPSREDFQEMDKYVRRGNFVFIASANMGKLLQGRLRLKTSVRVSFGVQDSTSVNLVNPHLKRLSNYQFRRATIDEFFSKVDTVNATVLGINDEEKPNFIRLKRGKGAYLIHAAPLCFSNYFILFRNNADYTSAALSYLPRGVNMVFWDEYYKLGATGAKTPLRFFLSNRWLNGAFWLALIGLITFVLFGMKRRQRIIPVIPPLRNSTVDFINTISAVYLQQKDNQGIARKKITHFLAFLRNQFFIPTTSFDEQFIIAVSRKSGLVREEVEQLTATLREVEFDYPVSDALLVTLNNQIDNFYKKVK